MIIKVLLHFNKIGLNLLYIIYNIQNCIDMNFLIFKEIV